MLVGRPAWAWQSACCGFAGDERSPSTEGYAFVLRFDAQGVVRAVRNDVLLMRTRYWVDVSESGPTGGPSLVVTYDDPLTLGPGIEPAPSQLVVLLENGELLLRNRAPGADCYADWRFLPRLAGARLREDGKYVSLMERDGGRRWRYVWSIFNRDGLARRLDN